MANSDKDILITPNKGTGSLPEINFVGQGNNPIKLRVLDDNTVSFEGSQGQLFAIDNNLTTGTIFAASDVSGVPSIAVEATGQVRLAYYNGYTEIGGSFTSALGSYKLDVVGSLRTSSKLVAQNGLSADWDRTEIYSDGTTSYYDAHGAEYGMSLRFAGTDRIRIETSGKTKLGSINRSITTDSKMTTLMVRGGGYGGTIGTATAAIKIFPAGGGPLSTGRANQFNAGIAFQHLDPTYSSWGESYYGSQSWIGQRTYDTPGQERDYLVFATNSGTGAGSEPTPRVSISPFGNVYIGDNSYGTSYRLNVAGDINFTGELYKNGSKFETLPAQSASTIGAALRSNGTNAFWDTGGPNSGGGTSTLPYAAEDRYRVGFQISRGYAMGGYRNSTSYKNVCSINIANNTLTNHGDILTNGQGYCAGAQNLSMYGYVMIAVNGVGGTGSTVSKINMNTSSNANTTSINNNRSATSLMKRDFKYAYVYGGGDNRPDRFNLTNDTSALAPNGNPAGNENNPAGGNGATYGWTRRSGAYAYAWASETYAAWPNSPGTDGSNKTMSARHGYNYWNTAGGYRTSSNLSKRSSYTGSEATQVGKFECGEETFFTGMNRGYMCGIYDGAQKNTGAVLNYAAETFTADSNIDRVGPPGSASGAGTEFGTVLAGYDGV